MLEQAHLAGPAPAIAHFHTLDVDIASDIDAIGADQFEPEALVDTGDAGHQRFALVGKIALPVTIVEP